MTASAPPQLSRRTRWTAYIVAAFGLGVSQAWGFLIPLRARELGASFEVIGIIVATYSLAPVLLSVPLGAVVDRFGSRRSFIVGTALTGCVAAFGALVEHHWLLLALQVGFGSARGLGWIASQTYVTSLGRGVDSATLTGRFSFFSNVGLMSGPLMAGAVAELVGFRWAR